MILKTFYFWSTAVKAVFLLIFTLYAGLLTIFSVILGYPFLDFIQTQGLISLIIVVLISIICGLLYATNKWLKDNTTNENIDAHSTEKIYEALSTVLEKLNDEKDYAVVIRLGSAVSRVLWIAGQYRHRISIGEIIFSATCKLENFYEKARVQIDDIGWTYFVIKEIKMAIENIRTGLSDAQKINDSYLIAKAYRHLSGIYLFQKSYHGADESIRKAKEAAKKIPDPVKKKEMLAGIEYSHIEIQLSMNKDNLPSLLEMAQKVLEEYVEIYDLERRAKSHSQIGKIYLLKGDLQMAISSFTSGLGIAEKSCRRDEIIKCLMGLAVTYRKRGDMNKAQMHKLNCEKLLQNGENFVSWDEVFGMYNNIPNIKEK